NLYRMEGNGPTTSLDPRGLDFWTYLQAAGEGVVEGGKNLAIGAGNAAVELGQVVRDTGNSVISAGSQVTNAVAGTGVYSFDLHSQTIGGYDLAIKNGNGDR